MWTRTMDGEKWSGEGVLLPPPRVVQALRAIKAEEEMERVGWSRGVADDSLPLPLPLRVRETRPTLPPEIHLLLFH